MVQRKLKVTLKGEVEVEIVVEMDEGDEPTDLTREDRQAAIAAARNEIRMGSYVEWEVDDVREIEAL